MGFPIVSGTILDSSYEGRKLGNIVYFRAILIYADIEPDPIVDVFICHPNRALCLKGCPVDYVDGVTVNQKFRRKYSTLEHPRGRDIYTCSKCR